MLFVLRQPHDHDRVNRIGEIQHLNATLTVSVQVRAAADTAEVVTQDIVNIVLSLDHAPYVVFQ